MIVVYETQRGELKEKQFVKLIDAISWLCRHEMTLRALNISLDCYLGKQYIEGETATYCYFMTILDNFCGQSVTLEDLESCGLDLEYKGLEEAAKDMLKSV